MTSFSDHEKHLAMLSNFFVRFLHPFSLSLVTVSARIHAFYPTKKLVLEYLSLLLCGFSFSMRGASCIVFLLKQH